MKERRAKLFVSHYPPDLAIYKNIAAMARSLDPDAAIILFGVAHPYRFDISPYKNLFDTVIEFPFIEYTKNVVRGIRAMRAFKQTLNAALQNLREFEHIDVYIEQSAWLPANALIYALATFNPIKHIYRITVGNYEIPDTRVDILRTWFCRLYHLFINVYPIEAMRRTSGGFATFRYKQKLPGILVRLTNPTQKRKPSTMQNEYILPYPVLAQGEKQHSIPHGVIVFGDKGFLEDFPDYVASVDAKAILSDFFRALETHYKKATLYYKPHPGAPETFLPGMTRQRYTLLPASLNAQAILEERWPNVRAAYTFFSTSVAWSSFFGIPSYTMYRLIYNAQGVKRLDETFTQPDIVSPLIFPISVIHDIGKIDEKKTKPNLIDLNHIPNNYRAILA